MGTFPCPTRPIKPTLEKDASVKDPDNVSEDHIFRYGVERIAADAIR